MHRLRLLEILASGAVNNQDLQSSPNPCSPIPVLPDIKKMIESLEIEVIDSLDMPKTSFYDEETRRAVRSLPVPSKF